jgi:hypothetical protein
MCKDNKSLFKIIKENKKKPPPKKSRSRSPSSKQVDLHNVKLDKINKKLAESQRKQELEIQKKIKEKKKKAITYLKEVRKNLDLGEHKMHSQLSRRIQI